MLLLTVIILWVRHNQSKGSQEYDVHKVEEQVGKVEPSTESVPLVVEEAGHQRMLEELTAVVLHLNQQQIRHAFHRYFRNMVTSLVPRPKDGLVHTVLRMRIIPRKTWESVHV